VATTISADGGTYSALSVSLQDSFGNPAVAPNNIVVQLASSRPDIITVASPVLIKTGETYAFAMVKTGLSPGTANITASASGYGATSTVLTSVVPAPDKLALYVGPNSTVNSLISHDALLTVQLQDVNGLPARAQATTTITITASNTSLLANPVILKIAAGSDYATTYLTTSNAGITSMTASSPGLGSSSLTLNVVSNPVTETITAGPAIIFTNETSTVYVNLVALGQGIQGAQVLWYSNYGTLSSPNSTTNAAGVASVTFGSSVGAVSTITAVVNSPFASGKNLTTTVVVQPIVAPPGKSFSQEIGPYLIYIIIIIVVVVAVVLYLFWYRPRSRRNAAANPEAEETQPYDELEEIPGSGEPGAEGNDQEPMTQHFDNGRTGRRSFRPLVFLHLGKVL
jgi:cbb3-type cytochrome oxidase subunit 3